MPFKYKYTDVKEAIDSGNFYLHKKDGKIFLQKQHTSLYQVKHVMDICKLKHCDFVVWGTGYIPHKQSPPNKTQQPIFFSLFNPFC